MGKIGLLMRAVVTASGVLLMAGQGSAIDLYANSNSSVYRYNASTGTFVNVYFSGSSGGYWAYGGPTADFYMCDGAFGRIQVHDGPTGLLERYFTSPLFGQLFGITFGPDNMLYVTSAGNGSIVKVDPITGAATTFVPNGLGGLTDSRNLRFGPDGNLYVCSNGAGMVKRFDGLTGAYLGDATVGGIQTPDNLAFGPDGMMYVSSWDAKTVSKFNPTTGAFISTFVPQGTGGMQRCRGLDFGPDGNLYVCDPNTGNIFKFNGTTGAFISIFVTGLGSPDAISFGPSYSAAPVTSVSAGPGDILAGGTVELSVADDNYLYARPGPVLVASSYPLQVIMEGTSPAETIGEMRFELETAGSLPNLTVKVEFFNFTTNAYEVIDTRTLPQNDLYYMPVANTNPSRFVQPITRKVRAKISTRATGAVLLYPWNQRIDFARWQISL